jgi:hypothetical protein
MYARCKQGTKNPELLHRVPNITYDRNSFFKKACRRFYLLVKIHKTLQGKRQGGLKNKYYRNGSCQIKVFFCWTLRSSPSRSTLGIPGIVDIGAKPKKAWFDFWLTLLFIAFCQLVLISVAMCATLVTQTLPYTSEAACFPADS